MTLRFPFLLLLLVAPVSVFAQERDFAWASGLGDAEIAALSAPELGQAVKLLWNFGYYEPDAAVKPTAQGYREALRKARTLARLMVKKDPALLEGYALLANVDYDYGEGLVDDDERLKLYDEMVSASQTCLDRDPKNGDCWHWLATGVGRRSTTIGLLNSAMKASEVEKAWLKALALKPKTVLINSDPTETNIRYGLTVFYRMVPDSWFMKLFTGTRGDKKKALMFAREMIASQPYRLELQKEYGVALTCYGDDEGDKAALAEGKTVLQAVVDGKFDAHDLRLTDDIDKKHSREIIAKPALACGYSRDGYQDLDESKLKK